MIVFKELMQNKKTLPFIVAAVVLLLGALFIWLDTQGSDQVVVTPAEVDSSPQVAGIQSFETEYFSFQTEDSWEYLSDFSIPGSRYRYRLVRDGVHIGNLRVLIDDSSEQEVERVLPVTIGPEGVLESTGSVSDRCSDVSPDEATVGKQAVTKEGVRFLCDVDSTSYSLVVGEVGGTARLQAPAGGTVTVIYSDVSINPSPLHMENLVRGFRLK